MNSVSFSKVILIWFKIQRHFDQLIFTLLMDKFSKDARDDVKLHILLFLIFWKSYALLNCEQNEVQIALSIQMDWLYLLITCVY